MVRWLPLESNPEVFNKLLDKVATPGSARLHDVFSLDPEMLSFLPQPAHALLMLYPLTDQAEAFRASQETSLLEGGQEVSPNVFFMKQYVGNACGTVALLHALANNTDNIPLQEGPLKEFFSSGATKTPEERGHDLEKLNELGAFHEEAAGEGQTQAPDRDEKLTTHFIAFVNVAGHVYELDGRKSFPINHGATTPETFIQDTATVIQGFMSREDPDENRFTMMALCAPQE